MWNIPNRLIKDCQQFCCSNVSLEKKLKKEIGLSNILNFLSLRLSSNIIADWMMQCKSRFALIENRDASSRFYSKILKTPLLAGCNFMKNLKTLTRVKRVKDTMKAYFCYRHTLLKTIRLWVGYFTYFEITHVFF